MRDLGRLTAHENQTRRPRPIIIEMQTQRIRPLSGNRDPRIKLSIVVSQQRAQRCALTDRIALKFRTIPKLRKLPVRRADLRTLEIVDIEIRQQMESRLQLDHFDRRAAIVSDERLFARNHQQVERIVVRPALAPRELRRFRRSTAPQRVEAQQPARSRIRIRAILRAPIQQSRHHPVLANPKPGASRFQILPAHNMRMPEQGSGVVCRPVKKLVAISGDHDRTIARSPKVNSQRAHPYKIGSPQASRTRPLFPGCRGLPCPRESETHGGFHI